MRNHGIFLQIPHFYKNKSILKKQICFIPDTDIEDLDLTVYEYMNCLCDLYQSKNITAKLRHLIQAYDIEPYLNNYVATCSHGTIKKINLIIAFATCVKLIILDEPFNGLDPEYTQITKQIIKELPRHGASVLLSCHNLNIVEDLSDFIILLIGGRLEYQGSIQDFKSNRKISSIQDSWLQILKLENKIHDNLNALFALY